MSHDFWKFMVHDFLKINVPRFFEIHSPRFFGIQCPTIFCDFGLLSRLAQAGGGGAYYMIFHYQKHTVLNYYCCCCEGGDCCCMNEYDWLGLWIFLFTVCPFSSIPSANSPVKRILQNEFSCLFLFCH